MDKSLKKRLNDRSEITDDFLKAFAERYTQLKDSNMIPKQIFEQMMEDMNCGKTTYYTYLKRCREAGFITDSFEQTRAEMYKRKRTSKYETLHISEGHVEREIKYIPSPAIEEQVQVQRANVVVEEKEKPEEPKKKSFFRRLFGL